MTQILCFGSAGERADLFGEELKYLFQQRQQQQKRTSQELTRWIDLDFNIVVIVSPDPQKHWMKFIIVRFTDYFLHVQLLATAIFFSLAEYMII